MSWPLGPLRVCLSVCLRLLLTSRLSTSLVIDTLIHPAGLLTLSSESLEDECVTLRNLRIVGYFKLTRTLLWKRSKQIFVVVLVGGIANSPFFVSYLNATRIGHFTFNLN